MDSREIALDQLLLDPNNYRLQEASGYVSVPAERFQLDQVQKTTLQRLQQESLKELQKSIVSNGFLPIERIVVTPYEHDDKLFLVIEGNRRVAALKSLREQFRAGIDIPARVVSVFDAVPCIVFDHDAEFPFFKETLMGVRHVGGIKEWGGYQRAKLIVDLADVHSLELVEIAERLGLSVQEVNRRYRAFKAFQQMEQNEEYAEYADPSKYPLFHEAMSLPAVRSWLAWNDQEKRFENSEAEDQFFQLISPQKNEDTGRVSDPKLRTYADVRELKRILPNSEAKSLLLDDSRSFLDALTIARKDELSRKWKSEVSEAAAALENISALEVRHLRQDDVDAIKNLREMADQVLAIHKSVTGG